MYKISHSLASILGIQMDTRPRIIMHLWQFIRTHKLTDPDDKKLVICNPVLKEIFKVDKMSFAQLPSLLNAHLSLPDPIEIDYVIS